MQESVLTKGVTASSDVTVAGTLSAKTISGTSNQTVAGTLTVTKTLTGSSAVTSTKTLTGSSNLSVTGTATIGKLLTASSAATITKTLTASSQATVTKQLTASSALSVSGTATVGKLLTASSQATVTKLLTGSSRVYATLGYRYPYESLTGNTSGVTMAPYGISFITSTGAGKKFALGAPAQGIEKIISVADIASSSKYGEVYASSSSSITFDGSNNMATFKHGNQALHLIGHSASRWYVVSNIPSSSGGIVEFSTG
jgi:hypothetical protein